MLGVRIVSAVVIWALVFGASLAVSGAPTSVHIVDGVALFIAFWLPALWVRTPRDLLGRWMIWIPLVFVGLVFWDLASAEVIVKKDVFDGAHVLYPLGVVGMSVLLLVHAGVVWGLERIAARR